ncbi:hypothetical protein [Actinomadura luteofluorescens]|uniref:hypothetical protein n=1 Tax=Actinomadura luteofluorescens TaxID=46163 RepID=UPI003D944689
MHATCGALADVLRDQLADEHGQRDEHPERRDRPSGRTPGPNGLRARGRQTDALELCFDLPDRPVACLVTLAAVSLEPGRAAALVPTFTTRLLAGVTADDGAAEFVVKHGVTTDIPRAKSTGFVKVHRSMWHTFKDLVRRGQAEGEFGSGAPEETTARYFATLGGSTTMRLASEAISVPDIDILLRLLTEGTVE